MNTLSYKGHFIHIRWIGLKEVAHRVQIVNGISIHREVKSIRAAQLLITKFVNTGSI